MAHRKLSDAERWQAVGMVRGGMSYIKTAERFNVSHSVSPDNGHSALQTRCETDRLSTGALADGPSTDVLKQHKVSC